MNAYADNTQENKSQSVANAVSQKQGADESTFQFVDNRPGAIQMRKLQEMANNHTKKNSNQFVDNRPEAVAQRKLQEMANNSQQVSQLKAFQEMANNSVQINHPKTIQRKKGKKDRDYNVQQEEILRIDPNKFLRNDFISNHVSKKTDAMSKARERNLDMSTAFEMKPSDFGKEIREKNLQKNKLKIQTEYFSENSYPFISISKSPDGSFNIHSAGSARLNYMVEPFRRLPSDESWTLFQAHHLEDISPTAIEDDIESDDELLSESDLEINSEDEFDDF